MPVNLKKFGFEFENCKRKVPYSIEHKKKPLDLTREMTKNLEYLLWYVPNINSAQSQENELTSSLNFENFVFGIIKNYMNLENKDVAFLEYIDRDIVKFYDKKICPHSQKIILTKSEGESKTDCLLRHIRNSLAHGNFNIVEDMLVGFDYKYGPGGEEICTGIFKIFPKNLLRGLSSLDEEVTAEGLAQIALQRTGYQLERFKNEDKDTSFDFYVKKGSKRYALEIKKYRNTEVLSEKEVQKLLDKFSGLYDKIIPVLFINTSFLKKETKEKLKKERVIILDIKNILKMLDGRDILGEIESY
ncbi:MAG: restriction endonuclease [Peptoniphilus harei]|uniref:restriction endonuclease n=1 Tax=Peptoniphilus harei TaxID=54005 RepID=UPI0025888A92|nr:restriction endonuclease [Peptoniphilus harei]MDU2373291.1 restriction endonuclease [Peptoniphilus harei]MDU6743676.1 restriction endonuclease [Peptoniphilus harei]